MSADSRFDRIMRWYPREWRERYGEGFSALLDDTYGDDSMPRKVQRSLVRAGLQERIRAMGLVGGFFSAEERLRRGCLLVLSGWVFFMVAGAAFAKFTEHFAPATPLDQRPLGVASYDAVVWAGAIGMVIVGMAGLFVVPTLWRHVRQNGGGALRRPLLRSAIALATTSALFAVIVGRAHSMSAHQRNAGFHFYGGLVLVGVVAVIVTTTFVTSSVIAVSSQLSLSRRTLTNLSGAALGLCASMSVVVTGTVVWWVNESLHAPNFMTNSLGSGLPFTSHAFPPTLLVALTLICAGVAVAGVGVARVIDGLRSESDALTN